MLSWAAGIVLLGAFSRRLLEVRLSYSTLPSFLANDRSAVVRIAASIATVLSFVGVIYVEAFFATDLVAAAAGIADHSLQVGSTSQWWLIFAVITGATAIYSMLGGLRKVVANDVWQLAFAYAGVTAVFAILIDRTFERSAFDGLLMSLLCLAIFVTILIYDRKIFDGNVKLVSLIACIGIILWVGVAGVMKFNNYNVETTIPGLFAQVSEPYGWITLLGFTITNVLWQFADSSTFQRIAALRLSKDPLTGEREIRRAIRSLAVVSPLTWGLGIVLGMLIKTAGIPVPTGGSEYGQLVETLRVGVLAGNIPMLITLLGLVIALVAMMMSTVDVAIIAATQTFVVDVRNAKDFRIWHSVAIGIGLMALVALLAYVHKEESQTSILTVLAGAYGGLILLAPLTIARLMKCEFPAWISLFAMAAGLIGTIAGTFGPIDDLPQNVKLVFPIFTGFVPSLLVVVIGAGIWSKKIS